MKKGLMVILCGLIMLPPCGRGCKAQSNPLSNSLIKGISDQLKFQTKDSKVNLKQMKVRGAMKGK